MNITSRTQGFGLEHSPGHVARIGEMHTKFWSENLKRIDHLEDPAVDWKTIL
jgi:hypothetical protein